MTLLINMKALRNEGVFETRIPDLDVVLNDPVLRTLSNIKIREAMAEKVAGAEALFNAGPKVEGKALVAILQFYAQVGQDRRALSDYWRQLENVLSALRLGNFVLTPEDALTVLDTAIAPVFERKLFARVVDAIIAGGDGGCAQYLKALQRVARIDHIENLSNVGLFADQFSENIEASLKAHEALGGDRATLPVLQAVRAADRAEADFDARLKAQAHPLVANLLTTRPATGQERQDLEKAFNAAVKSLDRAGRSALFEGIFEAMHIIWQEPYFATPIGKNGRRISGRFGYETRWQRLIRTQQDLAKKPLDVSRDRALWLLERNKHQDKIACVNPHSGAVVGQMRILRLSVHLTRAIAASLPKGAQMAQRLSELNLTSKYRNILLEVVADVDRSDPEIWRQEAVKALDLARQAWANAPRDADLSAAEQARSGNAGSGIGGLLRRFLSPKQSVPQPSRSFGRPSMAMPFARQLASAILRAQHFDLPVSDDIDALFDYLEVRRRRAEQDFGPLPDPETLRQVRQQHKHYSKSSYLLEEARECFEIKSQINRLARLSSDDRALCQSLISTLMPAPAAQKLTVAWMTRAEEFAGSDKVEALLQVLLGEFDVPAVVTDDVQRGDGSVRDALAGETHVVQALIRLAGHCFPALAGTLERIATDAHANTTAQRLGSAALWALSDMPGGAGLPALKRLARDLPYPGSRDRALALVKAAGTEDGDVAAMAVDHGLSNGVREEALALGRARLSIELPDKIALRWLREDGKEGKIPTKAMKEADSSGIKRVKALVKQMERDLEVQAAALERLYRSSEAMPIETWRTDYLNHGTLGPLVRGLLWHSEEGQTVLPEGDGFVDADRSAVEVTSDIRLWHPLHSDAATRALWQKVLAARGLAQPFPQVWRDTYGPTDTFQDYSVVQDSFRKALLEEGWKGKICSEKLLETQMVLHMPGEDMAFALDVKAHLNAMIALELGDLVPLKLPLGAKPTQAALRKARALDPQDLSPVLLSEVWRTVAQSICKSSTAFRIRYGKEASVKGRQPDFAALTQRYAVIDHVIEQHDMTRVAREGSQLIVQGDVATYTLCIHTGSISTDEGSVRLYVKPTSLVPGVPLPHGRDPGVYDAMARVEKLLDDARLVDSKRGYGVNSISLPGKRSV